MAPIEVLGISTCFDQRPCLKLKQRADLSMLTEMCFRRLNDTAEKHIQEHITPARQCISAHSAWLPIAHLSVAARCCMLGMS